jgi:hypothetical protein
MISYPEQSPVHRSWWRLSEKASAKPRIYVATRHASDVVMFNTLLSNCPNGKVMTGHWDMAAACAQAHEVNHGNDSG